MGFPGAQLSPRRALLRVLLSLPTPVLRAMSGGAAVYRGGRTLDPRLQFLAAFVRRIPAADSISPDEARRASAQALAPLAGRPERGVRVERLVLEAPHGPVPARIYRPANQDMNAPIMVYAHSIGGVIGELQGCHAFCSSLADATRGPVLWVEHRLAPEHRFPAGIDDVAFAYRWARDNAGRFGAPPGRAAIGGDGMGGAFAAVIAQDLKAAGEPQPVLQLLICPCVDVASETASMTVYADAFPFPRSLMEGLMAHYVGAEASPADPRLSPLRAADLSGLAPAVIATAGFDPLVDQGELYARALRAAGVPVTYRCYDSLVHGFTAFTGAVPAAADACRQVADLVRQAFAAPGPAPAR